MENTIIMAHNGRPCDPPIICMPHGQITFEPNPAGGPLWLGYCTPEQVEDLKPYDFFFPFTEDATVPEIKKDVVPDETWTRAGIVEWAERELKVTIDMKRKADMLADLNAAIAKAEAEKAELPPFIAPEEEPAKAPETPGEPVID